MSQRRKLVESSSAESSEEEEEEDDEVVPSKISRQVPKQRSQQKIQKIAPPQQRQTQDSISGSSQMSTQCSDISKDEFERCSGLVANYFLAAECKKVPVKRADLIKVVGKQHTKRLPQFIVEASKMLEGIYGYRIEELQQKKHSFLLLNCLSVPVNQIKGTLSSMLNGNGAEESGEEADEDIIRDGGDDKQGLLYVLLAVIFMMGGVVEEVTLFSFLKCLGVYVESKDSHAVFGNTKKVLEEFIRQSFLEVLVLKDMEPPTRQYSWGERAHFQVCKKTLLEFVCKVYGGGMRPENWVDHWSKIVGSNESSAVSSSVGSSVEEIMEVDP